MSFNPGHKLQFSIWTLRHNLFWVIKLHPTCFNPDFDWLHCLQTSLKKKEKIYYSCFFLIRFINRGQRALEKSIRKLNGNLLACFCLSMKPRCVQCNIINARFADFVIRLENFLVYYLSILYFRDYCYLTSNIMIFTFHENSRYFVKIQLREWNFPVCVQWERRSNRSLDKWGKNFVNELWFIWKHTL